MSLRCLAVVSLTLAACSCDRPVSHRNFAPKTEFPSGEIKPFPDATEVRLFVEKDYENGRPIYTKASGLVLTKEHRRKFESAMHVQVAPEAYAACFIPHHFFRYYNESDKLLGEFSVCFCCAGIRDAEGSGIKVGKDQELSFNYARLADLVRSLGEPTDVQCDPE